jgi:hypothetical protein
MRRSGAIGDADHQPTDHPAHLDSGTAFLVDMSAMVALVRRSIT